MSIVYTEDVFCDGEYCPSWTHGATSAFLPTKAVARANAQRDRFTHHKGKDYCPTCWAKYKDSK